MDEHLSDSVDLEMTVLEVVGVEDTPASIKGAASEALAEHGMTWSDIKCVIRVEKNKCRGDESWLLSPDSADIQLGARLFSQSSWAIAVCRFAPTDGGSRAMFNIHIIERVIGASC